MHFETALTQHTPRAVLLDAEGTFLHIHPSVGYVYAETLARFGYKADYRLLDRSFLEVWRKKKHTPKRQIDRETNYRFWKEIFLAATSPFVSLKDPERVFEACFYEFAKARWWRVAPGFLEALERWEQAGVQTGVVSNWDERLRMLLEEMGLKSRFRTLVISAEVGLEKPDPEILRMAFEDLGISPGECLFIGDTPEIDLVAAARAGCKGLLYDPARRHLDLPCRFESFLDLAHGSARSNQGPFVGSGECR